MSNLSRVVEDFGPLRSVHLSEFQPGWLEAIRLDFHGGALSVEVNGDDDTVRWEVGSLTDQPGDTPAMWIPLLSSRVRWIWLLTNHRGFQDAIQMEFSIDDHSTCVQFMAEASRLSVYRVEQVTSPI